MALTSYDRRQAIRIQYEQLLLLVTTAIANPTPANLDAATVGINALTATGLLVLRADYSLDGESYNWNAVRGALLKELEDIDRAIQRARPYMLLTRYHT